MRPAGLFDTPGVTAYGLHEDQAPGIFTSRADLAASMLDQANDTRLTQGGRGHNLRRRAHPVPDDPPGSTPEETTLTGRCLDPGITDLPPPHQHQPLAYAAVVSSRLLLALRSENSGPCPPNGAQRDEGVVYHHWPTS